MPLEIERKFRIEATSVPYDNWPVPYEDWHIFQVGLHPHQPHITSERVREVTVSGRTQWTHTQKVFISHGVHQEQETEITEYTFDQFLQRTDLGMLPIHKTRRVFDWEGHTFELDTFGTPFAPLVLLEVELPSLDTPVTLPPFFHIEADVTKDSAYTNAALARAGRWAL